mgnify:CR=1 FL=1
MAGVVQARASRGTAGPMAATHLWKVACVATLDELDRRRAGNADVAKTDPLGQEIAQALRGLASSRRGAVALYLQGHPVPETARLLEWAPKRTESVVDRGLAELAKGLQRPGPRGATVPGHEGRWMRESFATVTGDGEAGLGGREVDEIWTAVRGDLGGERVATLAERITKDPTFAEVWRVAMAFADSAAADEEETADAFEALSGAHDLGDEDEGDDEARASAPSPASLRWIAVGVAVVAALAVVWWLR